jgi:hypothetical protein
VLNVLADVTVQHRKRREVPQVARRPTIRVAGVLGVAGVPGQARSIGGAEDPVSVGVCVSGVRTAGPDRRDTGRT